MTDLMREEFEKAIAEKLTKDTGDTVTWLDIMNCRDGDEYKVQTLSSAWWGWQASRDALVIDIESLSISFDTDTNHEDCGPALLDRDDVAGAIHAAGIKTNPPT